MGVRATPLMGRRRVLAAIVLSVALPLAALVVAWAAGLTIDVSRWREALAQRASAALSRPVLLHGAVQLTLGAELELRIAGLRVLNPPGFDAPEFLAVGDARVRIGWLDALRGRARLRSVEASDIGLWLERGADGRSNWDLAPPRDPAAAPAGDRSRAASAAPAGPAHCTIARSSTRRAIDLDELEGSAGSDDAAAPGAARAGGRQQVAYRLRVDGAALRLLQDGSRPWPFSLDLQGGRRQAARRR